MTSDAEYLANLRKSAAALSLLAMSLQHFATQLVKAGSMNDETLARIRADTILGLKNSHATGLPIEAEAKAFGEAIAMLENSIDAAIMNGRKPHQG